MFLVLKNFDAGKVFGKIGMKISINDSEVSKMLISEKIISEIKEEIKEVTKKKVVKQKGKTKRK